jgi:phage-related protein
MASTFTWLPDFKSKVSFKPNVRVASFGDGYEQRVQFGINANPQIWALTFTSREDAEASAIDGFLQAQGSLTSFFWTPPGGVPLKFVCREWDKAPSSGNGSAASPAYFWDLTAKFEQVFEP